MEQEKLIHSYWEKNIGHYSEFYDKTSEENIGGPAWLAALYKRTIFPMERKVTRQRYEMVKSFILNHVKPGQTVVDLGCGSGIFSMLLAEHGAKVISLDFAQSAVELTKKRIPAQLANRVEVHQFDVLKQSTPKADSTICVGLVPYIADMQLLMNNILPNTNQIWFNFLDKGNTFNLVRSLVPGLNVRHCYLHSPKETEKIMQGLQFEVKENLALGTGRVFRGIRQERPH